MKKRIAVSLYVFDFLEIGRKIQQLVDHGITWLHIDIMDGVFVNNYALCQKFIADIKHKYPRVIVDAHMMCVDSDRYIESFGAAQTDYFIFHYESIRNKFADNINNIIHKIRIHKMKPIIAINPETSLQHIQPYFPLVDGVMLMNIYPGFDGQAINPLAIPKIAELHQLRGTHKFLIMTDGGARETTYQAICAAGADVIVAGAFVNVADEQLQVQIDKIQAYDETAK